MYGVYWSMHTVYTLYPYIHRGKNKASFGVVRAPILTSLCVHISIYLYYENGVLFCINANCQADIIYVCQLLIRRNIFLIVLWMSNKVSWMLPHNNNNDKKSTKKRLVIFLTWSWWLFLMTWRKVLFSTKCVYFR